ncbi:Uncharacterized conserved protein (DUF2358) [Seminavis robusta]|uniref:Uncharacterized conserved protein (DUF2358) n=1 Tax=Seminavis robusta TaxID=568900 RepID=A0A9N8DRF5_9STRA|nr:Uncharacterized conserved protein (DUF2358) [Seminavis robusta]|eukprot:Sro317_g115780.1 Uncharacterized conserved protein (DUF2358) (286) ;mRNA; r:63330-64381
MTFATSTKCDHGACGNAVQDTPSLAGYRWYYQYLIGLCEKQQESTQANMRADKSTAPKKLPCWIFSVVVILLNLPAALAFAPVGAPGRPLSLIVRANKDGDDDKAVDALSKTSWYVVEAFGKVFGSADKDKKNEVADSIDYSMDKAPSSAQETLQRILDDYNRSYFLSGQVDALIYDEQCVFSDPFVAFAGRDRFIENLANLGSFITKYSVKPITTEAKDPLYVKTKCMVKLELALPWKPVLAWPWGVDYTIDSETFLITEHKESWDIEPLEGVKQIFRKPTTQV